MHIGQEQEVAKLIITPPEQNTEFKLQLQFFLVFAPPPPNPSLLYQYLIKVYIYILFLNTEDNSESFCYAPPPL